MYQPIQLARRSLFIVFAGIFAFLPLNCPAADNSFADWERQFADYARQRGISEQTLNEVMPNLTMLPRVIELDQKQPEKKVSFATYLQNTVTPHRIEEAQALYREHQDLLNEVAARYHVQPRFILALWGIETDFGHNIGGFSVLDSLATLAWDGRRAAFFDDELLKALQIIDSNHFDPQELRGSWAGAMGQVQFMPSAYLKYAVSFSDAGTGPDIWHNLADVFASTANYLRTEGWRDDQGWGRAVTVTHPIDPSLAGLTVSKKLTEWAELGIMSADGSGLPPRDDIDASLVQPDGPDGPSWLVYGNYRVLMDWNRSTYFATAVGLFADQIGNL